VYIFIYKYTIFFFFEKSNLIYTSGWTENRLQVIGMTIKLSNTLLDLAIPTQYICMQFIASGVLYYIFVCDVILSGKIIIIQFP